MYLEFEQHFIQYVEDFLTHEEGVIWDLHNWGIRKDHGIINSIRDAMIGQFYGYTLSWLSHFTLIWNDQPENQNRQVNVSDVVGDAKIILFEYVKKLIVILDRQGVN